MAPIVIVVLLLGHVNFLSPRGAYKVGGPEPRPPYYLEAVVWHA